MPEKLYLYGREVSSIENHNALADGKLQFDVQYADGLAPSHEWVHEDEFNGLKSADKEESESPKRYAENYNDATIGTQKKIIDDIQGFNPRYFEVIRIIQRVADKFNSLVEELKKRAYGEKYDAGTLTLAEAVEAGGGFELPINEPEAKELWNSLISCGVTYRLIRRIIPAFVPVLDMVDNAVISKLYGVDVKMLRVSDIREKLEAYGVTPEQPAEGDGTSVHADTQDAGGNEDGGKVTDEGQVAPEGVEQDTAQDAPTKPLTDEATA